MSYKSVLCPPEIPGGKAETHPGYAEVEHGGEEISRSDPANRCKFIAANGFTKTRETVYSLWESHGSKPLSVKYLPTNVWPSVIPVGKDYSLKVSINAANHGRRKPYREFALLGVFPFLDLCLAT